MSTRKPIYVFEGGGSDPHVIATIDTDKFSDHDSKAETAVVSRKVNNISTIEITIPTNCEASKLITNTSDLVLFDSKGNIQEFHITDIDDMDEYSVNRTIYAEQSFGELINNIVTGDTAMPTTTNPSDYLAYILSFTRWSVGTVDTSIYNAKWEEDLTGLTCLEAFQKLVEKYNCEFEVRYTIDGKNKITGRYVDLKKKIGNNYGKRFEDKKDIIGLKRNLDLDSIKTAIYPRIKIETQDENGNSITTYIDISSVAWSVANGDPVDKPLGQTVLVNPEADEIYKRYNTKTGNLMEKIMYAEWTGDTASDAEDLCRQAWSILKANGVLTPTIEVTASDLYRMSGNNSDYSHEQVDLGDTCIIIDKNFEPELRITTRVMEIEEDILNPVNNTYVFGNYRKTLATSNIESQKSIEDQLTQLQDRIQSITIPEYSLPYQSGKDYYADIKEQVQNEFMSSSGYVMAQDADGFWVFDAPVAQTYSLKSRSVTTVYPTKATILKGGCLALAEYNTATSSWEIGTFINGTSVNADYINTGHLSGDRIEANSITADHLKIAAVEYIRNGLATEEDLQNVINDIQANYATTDAVSNAISEAVSGLDPEVTAANAKVNSINISFDAIDIEYKKNLQQANTLLENSYLTGAAKTNLSNAKADYISKFTAVQTAKNDIVNNVDVSDAKMTAYNNALSAFKTSATTLGKRMEEAATAINSAVASDSKKYADGLKTSLDSEISDVSSSVSNLESTMNNAFKDSVISEAEAIAIQQQLDRLDTEKTDIDNEYSTLMYNSNLTGTAKTTLTSKYNAHATAYTNLVNAINNAIGDNNVDNAERTEIENCKTAYNTALGEYRTAAQSAIDAISSKRVENAMVNVVDSKALQDAINTAVQGLATEDYVNGKASQAKDEATIAAQVKAITDLQKQLQTEYKENNAKANKVYSDKYLPAGSTAKTDLNNKITAYTTAYNNYNNYITTMLSDNTITNTEYSQYSSYADAYSTALKNLAEAMEVANSTRLENVYTQARAGLVTTAELEVNNESVIASAKAGMVSTEDMTASINAATQDLVSNNALNSAIDAIKIGGTNLAKQTKLLTSKTGDVNWGVTSTGTEGFNKLYLNSSSTNWVECQIPLYTEINSLTSQITVSFEYQETNAGAFMFSLAAFGKNGRLIEIDNVVVSLSFTLLATRGDWKYVSYTFDPTYVNGQTGATHYNLQFKKRNGKTDEIHVRKIKIEIGNKATEWTPAPQDVTDYTDNAVKDKVTATVMNSAINSATADMATNSSVNTAISSAVSGLASENYVNNKVNSIEIGGRNLWIEKNLISAYESNGNAISSSSQHKMMNTYTDLNGAKYVTVQLWNPTKLNNTNNTNRIAFYDSSKAWISSIGTPRPNGTTYVSGIITAPTNAKYMKIGMITGVSQHDNSIKIKVELGNKATDWSPAPEDVTDYTDNAVKDKVTNNQMNSAINTATKDMATNSSVNTAIGNIQIGGRNLLLNSGFTQGFWNHWNAYSCSNPQAIADSSALSGYAVKFTSTGGGIYQRKKGWSQDNPQFYPNGSVMTVSGYVKSSVAGKVLRPNFENAGQNTSKNITCANANTWYYFTHTYTIASNEFSTVTFYGDSDADYYLKDLMLEYGNKASTWTPAPEDVANDSTMTSRIESIVQSYNAITIEYKNNLQQANTLYANSYLVGTAKTNLNSAKSDYTTKYNAVTTAYNNVVADANLTDAEVTEWNTAITNLQSSTTTLAQRVQEASTYINTAVYNSSKSYTDTAIPDALTGYAKTKYVDDAKAAAIADARNGMVSTSQLEVNNTEILMKTASMGQYNLLRNTDYRAGTEHWNSWGTGNGIKIKIGTSSDYVNCMSGERNLGVTTDSSITSLDHSVGFKQYVELTNNVTYTLSYWVNCVKCRCTVNIETNDTIGGGSTGILATKSYTNINGNQKRETWKYDSISFTVPKLATNYDKKVISVVFYIDIVSEKQARAWLVKPMLGTGINAQAWTAHPDEIHVGVVSVTEEEGIKVEHSDSDTYTTLDAAGLKIRSTNDDSLVASFGENNSAYIGTLTCDGYVKAPQLMPVANYKTTVHMYYCSEIGSGDFSGKSSSNQAIGWGGVMRAILSDLDIDFTHEKGDFIIPSNFTAPITIYIKGTEFSSDIVLGNIFGGGNSSIQLRIDAGCKFTGRIILNDIDIPVYIYGNNSTMYRGSSKDAPISLKNVKYCYMYQLKVNYSSQQIATVAVQMYDSNCNMTDVDMCNCYSAAALNRSHLFMNGCSGNLNNYVNGGQLSYLNVYGKVPAHTSSRPYGSYCINTTPSDRTLTPTGTTQSGGSSVTMNVTKTINITTYSSVLEYYRYGCLIQGTPSGSTANYVGNMTVSGVNKILKTMNNDVVIQVFLEREGVTTVDTDYVDVVIDGTKVGTLRSTASGWFNLPSSTVSSLKDNETVTIKLNATGKSNYTQYKLNAMLKITGTQTV